MEPGSEPGSIFVSLAEREGFEPSMQEAHIHAFQACSLNHSDTSPISYQAQTEV